MSINIDTELDQPNPAFAKIPILDTGKFKQWKFRIQQYLQNEHYALWEVIEFGDSYKAPLEESGKGPASESSAKKKGRTILRLSKYETTKELWEAILKTFGGNEATKKTKKNQLKQQYGNFKAEGSKTLEQTFNRLHAIVSHLEFMDVEIEQDDLNQKFLTSLAPEWLIAPRSQDRGKRESYKQGPKEEEPALKALMAIDGIGWDLSYMAHEKENHALVADDEVEARLVEFKEQEIKFCEKIRGLERDVEIRDNKIEYLMNELEKGNIDDKEYWDSGCSRHMTGDISYLSEYEPYNEGYVSYGQGG
nr:hypothetical protein [Tanacetum cinerariifolium]